MRVFGLIDCNNFYASCERKFQPRLNGKPIIVLSNNDGCVIVRSNEAKPFIKMGAAYHQIKPLITRYDIHVFSSNYALYGDMSRRVMETIADCHPEIEVYSIDEAFVSLHANNDKDLLTVGTYLRERILQSIGIPVSVGFDRQKHWQNWLIMWLKNTLIMVCIHCTEKKLLRKCYPNYLSMKYGVSDEKLANNYVHTTSKVHKT